jgi:hypoxanthine-guanine phosphoribosyltransferase
VRERTALTSQFSFLLLDSIYNDWEVILLSKAKREEKSAELAKQILENYQPETVEDMQNTLKGIFGPMFESMLIGEINYHLGYESNDKTEKQQKTEWL